MELVLTNITQLPKEICEYVVLTKFTWLIEENYFKVSVYQAWLANEGFSCFDILILLSPMLFESSNCWKI